MRKSQTLTLEQSRLRETINSFNKLDEPTDEQRQEVQTAMDRMDGLEVELRAAITAEAAEDEQNEQRHQSPEADPELRERVELRSRASLTRYLAKHGHQLDGAEAELAEAANVEDGEIPLELWDIPEQRATEQRATEHRAVTPAPSSGTGVNLAPLQPMVFAPSAAPFLRVEMPTVQTGTYSTATITTAATADAVAKGADVPETAGGFTATTTTPHRVGGSIAFAAEDVATVGQANFESTLRQHVSMVLSDHLDDLLLNGDTDTEDNETNGFFDRLTDPATPASGVAGWAQYLELYAAGVDGLWAETISDVALLLGLDSYRLALTTYRSDETDLSVSIFGTTQTAGLRGNKRMPATASHIQQGLLVRTGRPGMRTAVQPVWNGIAIDDIYTGARKGERRYVVSALVGDLILVQPGAYSQVALRVSV